MTALRPYSEYKYSGVDWIGDIPEHWDTYPHRSLFAEVIERGYPDEEMLSVTISQGVIRQAQLLANSSKKDSSNTDKSKYKLVSEGDIAYNKMRAWQGAIGVSAFRGIISPAYIIVHLRDDRNNPRYFHYLFRTPLFTTEAERWSYGITSDQWSLRYGEFKQIYSPLPRPDEQEAIVQFLDVAEKRIRRYVRAKQKLIKLLNEQKQAIIQQAITRGLHPNAPMKDSGVEWLGEIPSHWEVRRLGKVLTLQRGYDITKEEQVMGDIPVVSSGGVSSYHNEATTKAPGVVLGRKGSVGSIHYIEADFWAHDTTLYVRDFYGNHPRFVYYLFMIMDLIKYDTGSSNPTLNRNVLHPELVPYTEPNEQAEIAAFLDQHNSQIDEAVEVQKKQINLVQEYLTRLIADVVTGKVDVRGLVFEMPEEFDEDDLLDVDEDGMLGDDEMELEMEDDI